MINWSTTTKSILNLKQLKTVKYMIWQPHINMFFHGSIFRNVTPLLYYPVQLFLPSDFYLHIGFKNDRLILLNAQALQWLETGICWSQSITRKVFSSPKYLHLSVAFSHTSGDKFRGVWPCIMCTKCPTYASLDILMLSNGICTHHDLMPRLVAFTHI